MKKIHIKIKTVPEKSTVSILLTIKLFSSRSANRASTLASTAAKASVSVDLVLSVVLGNSTYGASISASAATEAFFFVYFVCHNKTPFSAALKFNYVQGYSAVDEYHYIYHFNTFFRKVKYIIENLFVFFEGFICHK